MLFRLFVNRVGITVGAKLFQFQPTCSVPTILGCGVARDTRRTLVGVRATLGTLQRNNNADALCHSGKSKSSEKWTQIAIISHACP